MCMLFVTHTDDTSRASGQTRSTLVARAQKESLHYAANHRSDSNTVLNWKSGEIVCIRSFLLHVELFCLRGLFAVCEFIFIIFGSMWLRHLFWYLNAFSNFKMACLISAMLSLFIITFFCLSWLQDLNRVFEYTH